MSALTRSSTSWEHTRWGVQYCSGYRGTDFSCIPRPQCLLPSLLPAPSTGPTSSRSGLVQVAALAPCRHGEGCVVREGSGVGSGLIQVAALAPCRHGEGCVVREGSGVGSGLIQVAALAPRRNAHCIPILTLAYPPAPSYLPPMQDSNSLPVPRTHAVLEYLLCLAATPSPPPPPPAGQRLPARPPCTSSARVSALPGGDAAGTGHRGGTDTPAICCRWRGVTSLCCRGAGSLSRGEVLLRVCACVPTLLPPAESVCARANAPTSS